jgi:hypothetical protein
MEQPSPPNDLNSFLAGIGHICLQWALLEQSLLGIIAAAENMPLEKTYTRYGTTDMVPRMRMAIRLVEEAKWPHQLQRRLRAIRDKLQNGKLSDQRNLFVHGVHKGIQSNGMVQLTMVRWSAPKREQLVSVWEAVELANQLSILAQEAGSILDAYGAWKFGPGLDEDRSKHIAEAKPLTRFIRAQQFKRAVKAVLGNNRP